MTFLSLMGHNSPMSMMMMMMPHDKGINSAKVSVDYKVKTLVFNFSIHKLIKRGVFYYYAMLRWSWYYIFNMSQVRYHENQ